MVAIATATDGHMMDEMNLDNSYYSGSNLDALNKANIDGYVATDRQDKPEKKTPEDSNRQFVKWDFIYIEKEDSFQCPAGKKLTISANSRAKQKIYRANTKVGQKCIYYSRCNSSKRRASRIIQTDEHEGLRQSMSKKMATAEAKKAYDARKITVEPAFGHIKIVDPFTGNSEGSGRIFIDVYSIHFKKIVREKIAGAIHLKMRIECEI